MKCLCSASVIIYTNKPTFHHVLSLIIENQKLLSYYETTTWSLNSEATTTFLMCNSLLKSLILEFDKSGCCHVNTHSSGMSCDDCEHANKCCYWTDLGLQDANLKKSYPLLNLQCSWTHLIQHMYSDRSFLPSSNLWPNPRPLEQEEEGVTSKMAAGSDCPYWD